MRTYYNIFDLTKFILSFIVVAIHTQMTETGPIMKVLCTLAVPLFFIISAFLLNHNMSLPNWGGHKRGIQKLLRLYIIWTIIYLPLTIYGYYFVEGHTMKECIFIFTRNFLVAGQNWMSWPLWFLHSLIVSMIILMCCINKGFCKKTIFILSVILLIMGKFISYMINTETDGICETIVFYYKKIFVGAGPLLSFIWVVIGFSMNEIIAYIGNKKIFVFIGMIVGISLQFLGFEDGIYLTVPSLFIILNGFQLNNLPKPLWFRKMSTIIYFGHMYVVFLFSYIIIDYPLGSWKSYFIICLIIFSISNAIIFFSNIKYFSSLKRIYS